jgi:hypothetical protein
MAVGASDETDLRWATSRRTAVTTAHWINRPHSLRELADEGPGRDPRPGAGRASRPATAG